MTPLPVPEDDRQPVLVLPKPEPPAWQVHLWAVCSDPRLDEVGRRKGWEVG